MGSGVEGVGPGAPPRGREHSGERKVARNCSGDLNSDQSPQAGTVLFYPSPLLPSLPNSPQEERGSCLIALGPGQVTLSCQLPSRSRQRREGWVSDQPP